jgi:succinate dehydrogenase hydrophobic anchor subunit
LDFQKIAIPAFSLCVHGGMGPRYHIADYVEKNKNGGHLKHDVIAYTGKY